MPNSLRQKIIRKLNQQLQQDKHLIGVAVGAGISAKYATMAGADFLLALNSGRFRQMGVGSVAGLMPFANSNKMVMEFGSHEIIPIANHIPVIFGLCATDPNIRMPYYLDQIKNAGFSGINNYPSVGIFEGQFREAIEENGFSYNQEVEAIDLAHKKDMFTVAFVFDVEQAKAMAYAGADIICSHLGFTKGGHLSGQSKLSIHEAVLVTQSIFNAVNKISPNTTKMIYGGPVFETTDLQYMYDHTIADGYIGGSSFERIPSEKAIFDVTQKFKHTGSQQPKTSDKKNMFEKEDYVLLIKEHIQKNYDQMLSFSDLANQLHVSRSYLSAIFNEAMGMTFPNYLAKYRIGMAIKLMDNKNIAYKQIAQAVGYPDYAYFSKVFKKYMGYSPKEYAYMDKKTTFVDDISFNNKD